MTKSKTNNSQTSNSNISILTISSLILSLLIINVIVLKGLEYDRRLFTWSFIALFLGLFLESYFIIKNLNRILNCFSISFFVSLFAFLPGKRERIYNLQNHIEFWPYTFLISFIIGIIILKQKEVTSKETEGTTLLQSLALIYWLVDYNFLKNVNFIKLICLVIIIGAILFSLINALTQIQLGKSSRLFLSIWSSIVLMCFAVDNIIRVFSNGDIDQQNNLISSILVSTQYFFVGISSVYIVQNINMLFIFFPEKNIKYKETLHTAKKMHLERYSNLQVAKLDSISCIFFCGVIFILNSIYNLLPRHTIIWIVIVTFPLFLNQQKTFKKNTKQHQ